MTLFWPLKSSSQASAGGVSCAGACARASEGRAVAPAIVAPMAVRRPKKERRGTWSESFIYTEGYIRPGVYRQHRDSRRRTRTPHSALRTPYWQRISSRGLAVSDRRSRREFLGLTAIGLAGTLTPEWLRDARGVSKFAERAPEPELIVHNAKVYTMDPAMPRAEALAVKGGRFVAIGKSADVRA